LAFQHTGRGDTSLFLFILGGNALALIITLLRIPRQVERNAKFIERQKAREELGFWSGTLRESADVGSKFLFAAAVIAIVLYLLEGTNLVGMLMDQSVGTIGLLALVLGISVFLTAAASYASNKQMKNSN